MSASSDPAYIPVPVSVAKEIAEKFAKDIIVIVAWYRKHEMTHTTTYGAAAELKDVAASWGEYFAKAVGADVAKTNWYEDYRATEAATYKAKVDKLENLLSAAREALKWARTCFRDDTDLARAIDAALDKVEGGAA